MRVLSLLALPVALLVVSPELLVSVETPELVAPPSDGHALLLAQVQAQKPTADEFQVTLAYMATIGHPSAGALLVRRPGRLGETILIVTDRTSNLDLARALLTAVRSVRQHGSVLPRELRAYIPATGKRSQGLVEEAEVLRQVKVAERRALEELGDAPALVVNVDSNGVLRRRR